MNVCCVIVTYADRFALLSKVVEQVLVQGVAKIVIIDNASKAPSNKLIMELVQRNVHTIILHRFSENEGSAKGFKTGLKIAAETACDFIWILDDDNLPAEDALLEIRKHWMNNSFSKEAEFNTALLCMRKNRPEFQRVAAINSNGSILPPRNNFLGFHIKKIIDKIGERVSLKKGSSPEQSVQQYIIVDAASYGGLFIHKNLLSNIGMPNEALVVYCDDFDFTYRITQSGGQIRLIPSSIVEDINTSFYFYPKKKLLYHSSLDGSRDELIYYNIRNSVYFTMHNRVTNRLIFLINKVLFIAIITGMGMLRGKFNRLQLIARAMKDGRKGKLGKVSRYPL